MQSHTGFHPCRHWISRISPYFLRLLVVAALFGSAVSQSTGQDSRRSRSSEHQPLYSLSGKSISALEITPAQAAGDAEIVSDRVLVSFQEGVPEWEKMDVLARVSPDFALDRDPASPFFDIAQIRGDGLTAENAILQLRADPRVRLAEPDYVVHASETVPNDPNFYYLWGLRNAGQGSYGSTTCTTCSKVGADISASKAWDLATGSDNVIVGVIDSGVDYKHPDLAANILRDASNKVVGYDFVNRDDDPMDDFGHGTHCAGIIGAVGNNGIGIAGVNWRVKIVPLKFLSSGGSGLTSDAVLAIDYAIAHGVQVLSNSWGGGGNSQVLLEAVRRAEKAGILFVASAGNSALSIDSSPSYPASYSKDASNVIAVAATDSYDLLASFSNYGPRTCDIAAPGSSIYSTLPSGTCPYCSSSGYGSMSGTSMAAPHVAGAAALIKARFPQLSLTQLKARLLYSADRPSEMDGYTRWGRLNVFRAMQTDTDAPGTPGNFSVTSVSATGLRLVWTAAGDDGQSGKASAYQIFYNTDPNVATATMIEPLMKPALSGLTDTYDLTGLTPQTAYYVFIRSVDKAGNTSAFVSAGPVVTTAATLFDGAEGNPIFSTLSGSPWTAEASAAHSGRRSYASPANISGNQYSSIRMIDAIRVTGPSYVSFWLKMDLGEGESLLPYVTNVETNANTYASGSYSGVSPWRQYRIDLSGNAGYSVRLSFSLFTRSTASGVSHRVWIDDISFIQLVKGWEDNVENAPGFSGLSPWSITTESSYSPTHAWSDSPHSTYKQNVRLPLMQASSMPVPENLGALSLVFRAKLDLEPNRDYLEIYASPDNGESWEYIGALTGTSNWTAYAFGLPGWRTVRTMFFLVTNEAVARDGVYLDDIGLWGELFEGAKSPAVSQVTLGLPAGGIAGTNSLGPMGNTSAGYATLSTNTQDAPSGTAVYSYSSGGTVLFETGVPATVPTKAARFFMEYRNSGTGDGATGINTGLAAVNSSSIEAHLQITLRDAGGNPLSSGTVRLAPKEHIAKLVDQMAPGFTLPSTMINGMGSLEIASDQPVALFVSRIATTGNGAFLVSNLPAADISAPGSNAAVAFPQIADGGGYKSTLVLMNTSTVQETGTIRFFNQQGVPFSIRMLGESSSQAQYSYSIAPGGFVRLVSDGSPEKTNTGWAQVTPDGGSWAPSAAAILASAPQGVLITEAGFPGVAETTHARIYVDVSKGHNTGLAIGNPGDIPTRINFSIFQSDGSFPSGNGAAYLDLPAKGYRALFVPELIPGLPDEFQGVLDISSASPFSALTIRSLLNEAGDFLMTAFPVADMKVPQGIPVIFPQVVDGGGYQTQILLVSTSSTPSAVTLRYLDNSGDPLAIGK